MQAIQRCARCPGQSDPETGPILCDNPLEDCAKFCPWDKPHQFTLTPTAIKTPYQILCKSCGYISPWEPLPYKSHTLCVLCNHEEIIRASR